MRAAGGSSRDRSLYFYDRLLTMILLTMTVYFYGIVSYLL